MVEIVSYCRVHRTGSSLMVVIPKDTVVKLGIKKGDQIKVKFSADPSLGVQYNDD